MKTLKSIFFHLTLALTTLVILNCGSSRPEIGERSKIGDSGKQPAWVRDSKDGWEKDNQILFRSLMLDQSDLSMGMEATKAKSIKEIAEKVSLKISSDLAFAEEGNSGKNGYASKYLISAVVAQTEQLKLSGFEPDETYWERYAVAKPEGMDYVYDIYRTFKLNKAAYQDAKDGVLSKGRALAQSAQDAKAVEEINTLIERNSRNVD